MLNTRIVCGDYSWAGAQPEACSTNHRDMYYENARREWVSHKDCQGIALQAPTCGCSLVGNEGLVMVVYGSLNYEGWALLQNFDSCCYNVPPLGSRQNVTIREYVEFRNSGSACSALPS